MSHMLAVDIYLFLVLSFIYKSRISLKYCSILIDIQILPNISRKKGNQVIRFGTLIE